MILRPDLSAQKPGPAKGLLSAAHETRLPVPAPETGRLDPGPLRLALPLPYPRPRPHPQSLGLPGGPRRPPRLVASEMGGFTAGPALPDTAPAQDPAAWLPRPWLGCGYPTPSSAAQEVSVRGQFPPLAPQWPL